VRLLPPGEKPIAVRNNNNNNNEIFYKDGALMKHTDSKQQQYHDKPRSTATLAIRQ
jgi:hypothetical protein